MEELLHGSAAENIAWTAVGEEGALVSRVVPSAG